MDFFAQKTIEKYGNKNIFDIYLMRVRGIYYDNLSSLQIIYVLEGEISIELDGEKRIFKKNDLIILNQFENKFIYSNSKNLLLITTIYNSYLKNLGTIYYESRFVNQINRKELKENILNNLILLYKSSIIKEEKEIKLNIIQQIIQILLKNFICQKCLITGISEKSNYLEEIQKLHEKGQKEYYSLNAIASNIHISISYLSKVFNQLTGINYSEYIQQLKLFYATTYVLNTKDTFEYIAEIVGFESTKSLNRIFNKYLDTTPSKYRKNFKNITEDSSKENLRNEKSFIEIFEKKDEINYEEYVQKNSKSDYSQYSYTEETKKVEKLNRNWRVIRNIKTLGDYYLENLDLILEKIPIEEIILRFTMLEDDKVLLTDLNRKIEEYELNSLLTKCIENNINLVIALRLEDLKPYKNTPSIVETKIKRSKKFFDLISNAIGMTNMKKFTYIFDIDKIGEFMKANRNLEDYVEILNIQKSILEEKLGTKDYKWGFELGNLTELELKELLLNYNKLKNKEEVGLNPSIISINYADKYENDMITVKGLENIREYIDDSIAEFVSIGKAFNFPIEKVYIKNLFEEIDISDINYLYRDLFLVNLMVESFFSYDSNVIYVSEYKVKDKNQEKKYYYPTYKDRNDFYTPVYWASLMVDKLKGNIVYNKPGCLITENSDDIYVLIYGSIVADYAFAQKNGFRNLEKHKRKIKLQIDKLEGRYKIVTETLSFEDATAGYFLKHFDNYKYLTSEEKDYIKRVAIPSLDISLEEKEQNSIETIEYAPFNLILRKYIKL